MDDQVLIDIEGVLGFELYDWQKDYILGKRYDGYTGRRSGRTTAYMIRLMLSEGPPINLYITKELLSILDGSYGPSYHVWFRREFRNLYRKFYNSPLRPMLRPVLFENPRFKNEQRG